MSTENIQDSRLLTINVGGKKYTTCRQTLTGLQLNYQHGRDNEGNIFIDRDGDYFKYVLNYMRMKKLILPKGYTDIDGLIQEAKHYGVEELEEELQQYKEKQTAILWVKEVSPGEQQQVQRASDEILLQCSLQTWMNLQFLQEIRNIKPPILYDGSEYPTLYVLKTQGSYFADKSGKVTIVYKDKFQVLSILFNEGFEMKQSWGAFTMYKHA